MTREEEIHKAAEEFAFSNKTKSSDFRNAMNDFYYGAEWADKHPKRYNQDELCDIQLEMMKQRDKRLIKKVCEWIKENIDIYAQIVINPKSHYPEITMCDTFEKNFKKAIDE